jgi:16S rRNA C967 or C1407 C5-methylase (RsmB/RsmF family)
MQPNEDAYPQQFTKEFIDYCKAAGIRAECFTNIPQEFFEKYRYVRFRPSTFVVTSELSAQSTAVSWLPAATLRACVIPRSLKLATLDAYKEGHLVCMDAASMASVVALDPQPSENVLDLCCSPGNKLLLIEDLMREQQRRQKGESSSSDGNVVGVDISLDRLFVARSLIRKAHAVASSEEGAASLPSQITLVHADGTLFQQEQVAQAIREAVVKCQEAQREKHAGECPHHAAVQRWIDTRVSNYKNFLVRKRQRESDSPISSSCSGSSTLERNHVMPLVVSDSMLRKTWSERSRTASASSLSSPSPSGPSFLFDKVLVDTECTHDGSVWHLPLQKEKKLQFPEDHVVLPSDHSSGVGGGLSNEHRMERMNFDRDEDDNTVSKVVQLQRKLVRSGFHQLRPNGVLVYSTCSFSEQQNEAIIEEFVKELHANEASLYAAELVHPFEKSDSLLWTSAERDELHNVVEEVTRVIHGSEVIVGVRFWPHRAKTSFQFVSKIVKRQKLKKAD